MRIAQVSPLYESVPPQRYGGTERIVSYLTESLVALGHDVTLFASGDSITKADLYPSVPCALRLSKRPHDAVVCHTLQTTEVAQLCEKFDIVHFHTDYYHFPLFRQLPTPQVTTLHGRLDLPDLPMVYEEFIDQPLVSISNSQRIPIPKANWNRTVYHGIPAANYRFQPVGGEYFAFLGRISPEKGPDRAIQIALQTETPLKIAAKVDAVDQEYFEEVIYPLIQHPLIEFIGEVDEAGKNQLLGGAKALLFPIDWPEPFGLVMIESMACGTPVIAFNHGSVSEVMRDGISGVIVESLDEAIRAARSISRIDRRKCRKYFEERFTDVRMANEYVEVYKELIYRRRAQFQHSKTEASPILTGSTHRIDSPQLNSPLRLF